MKKIAIMAVCLCLLSASAAAAAETGCGTIKPERVYRLLKDGSGIWFIDVRSPGQYGDIHIEGTINIPASILRNKEFPKNKFFVLADASPGQSQAMEAAGLMSKKGYENVFVLQGGVSGWMLSGYPVMKDDGFKAWEVTATELRWAVENAIPLTIFDMRDSSAREAGSIPGSREVSGDTYEERLKALNSLLKDGNGLSGQLERETIVLVFSAKDDAAHYTAMIPGGIKKDIRYLSGGYEVYEALGRGRLVQTISVNEGAQCRGAK